MPLFLSSYFNKVDKKGRVSVPASFRAELERLGQAGFFAFPHTEEPCIEGWDRARIRQLADAMDEFPPMSDEYAALGYLLGKSRELPFDPEGRIMLPSFMLESCGITDSVMFVGQGNSFQIWQPERREAFESRIKPSSVTTAKAISLGSRKRGDAND